MIGRPTTIKAHLTVWFAGALALVLVVVAAGVYVIVRAGVLGEVAARVRRDLETTATFVNANPGDVAEFAEFNPHALVLVLKDGQVEHRATAWEPLGLPAPDQFVADGVDRLWETPRHEHYRVAATTVSTGERTFTIVVAADEEPAPEHRERQLDARSVIPCCSRAGGRRRVLAGRADAGTDPANGGSRRATEWRPTQRAVARGEPRGRVRAACRHHQPFS